MVGPRDTQAYCSTHQAQREPQLQTARTSSRATWFISMSACESDYKSQAGMLCSCYTLFVGSVMSLAEFVHLNIGIGQGGKHG